MLRWPILAAILIASVYCTDQESYSYKILTLPTPLSHFGYYTNATFDLRYLVNDTFWKNGGPIFFYAGNEGDIEVFAQNTGLMWEMAPDYNAMLIFAEHRFYGKTMPFQEKSYTELKNLGYLASTEALADFVYLLNHLQKELKEKHNNDKPLPVIAFGGSYGGMLAAWLRLKYPWIVSGAVASSAPIYQFKGLTPCNTYSNMVSDVFKISSKTGNCPKNIKKSWATLRNITSSKEGKDWLSKEWKLCKALNTTDDFQKLVGALEDVFNFIPMINYPYPTNFLMPVPGQPVRVMCQRLDDKLYAGKELLTAIGKAISVYTNYTGTTKCFSVNNTSGGVSDLGWGFQACTDMVMPLCVDERNAIFEPDPWDIKKYSENCFKTYGVHVLSEELALMEYGGKDAEYSNVIFTNGLLDPWSPGGVLNSTMSSVYTILIPEAAHHLDLRASNPADPGTVIYARTLIRNILHMWLKTISNEV